ncbi:MAG TPA: PolC-type DNA polymerase III, partial [Firmicutes bacterium]|nr:PolC-type DNA polymerase III [Bacillota bacterium]
TMSNMDAVCTMDKYCAVAKNMGMDAIAVTDHGVVQAFPSAQAAGKKYDMKIIYGSELYMFDLKQKYIFNPAPIPLKKARYCVFDTETTGLSSRYDRIIEFGGILVENGQIVGRLNQYINPEMHIPEESSKVNHITDEMVKDKPTIKEVLPKILEFFGDTILVAHNATFDVGFINAALERVGMPPIKNPIIDTIPISHYLFPEAARHTEGAMLKNLGLRVYNEEEAHEAV